MSAVVTSKCCTSDNPGCQEHQERGSPQPGGAGQGGLLKVGTQVNLEGHVKNRPGKSKFIQQMQWSKDFGKGGEQDRQGPCFLAARSRPGVSKLVL